MRERDLWPGKFGMPKLLPLKGREAVKACLRQRREQRIEWELALTDRNIAIGTFRLANQIF